MDEQQPPRFREGRLKIVRAVLPEVPHRHPTRNFHPASSKIRFLENGGYPLHKDAIVVHRRVVDAKTHTTISLDVAGPSRFRSWDDIEAAIAVFKPARNDIRPAFVIETCDSAEGISRKKLGDFLIGHLPDLAAPFFVSCLCHLHLPKSLNS